MFLSGTYLNRTAKALISAFAPLLFILIVWKTVGICYETNDDVIITKILSGTATGTPDPHTIFQNYLLSYPLHLLYRISINVPWYGCFLVLCHIAMYAMLLQSIWSNAKMLSEHLLFGGIICCFAISNFYMTAAVQFTSTAALLAAAGYGCLFLHRNFKTGLSLFFGFGLIAYFLRSQAMLMIQPFGCAMGLALYFICEEGQKKELCKKAAYMVLAVLAIITIGYAGNLIGYHGEEWSAFLRFSDAEAKLMDYYGCPPYGEVKNILDKYSVTQAEYEAFCNYIRMDYEVDADCLEELVSNIEARLDRSPDFLTLFKEVWCPASPPEWLRITRIAQAVWMLSFLWILFQKRFYLLFPLIGIAAAKTVVWGYLYFRGRMPLRITAPLMICEVFLLVTLLARDYARKGGKKYFFLSFGALLTAACCFSLLVQYRFALYGNEPQKTYMQGLVEIQDYCKSRPENRYLLDNFSFAYYRGSVFRTDVYGRGNYVDTGSWSSNTPPIRQYLRDFLENHEKDFYLIISDAANIDCATAFFTEKTGLQPELTEQIVASHGGSYLIYHFGQ